LTGILDTLGQLPTAALVALAAVVAVQFGLQIYGLVDLSRRDRVAGGRKWLWLLAIVFGQMLGAIVYLVAGRSVPPSAEPGGRAGDGSATARRAIDSLYGEREEP
jgi:4-amino-4-deoxy-L-arabinose transferase-like glycosyltransferase